MRQGFAVQRRTPGDGLMNMTLKGLPKKSLNVSVASQHFKITISQTRRKHEKCNVGNLLPVSYAGEFWSFCSR
jgi:hypothetical protein